MAGADLPVTCRCGAFRAVLRDARRGTGSHLMCYCKDCQAGARALGAGDLLGPRGGTEIFQTTPSHIEIEAGQEHLACLRLSPKGLMRWYAKCCNTPVFNTLGGPRLAFAGVLRHALKGAAVAEAIGPVIAVANTGGAQEGPGTLRDRGVLRAVVNLLYRHAAEVLRGTVRRTPFFDAGGRPVVTPVVLTLEERQAAERGVAVSRLVD